MRNPSSNEVGTPPPEPKGSSSIFDSNFGSKPMAPSLKITRSSTFRPSGGAPLLGNHPLQKKLTLFQAFKTGDAKPKDATFPESEHRLSRTKQQTLMVRSTDKKTLESAYKQVRPDALKSATSDIHTTPKLKLLGKVLTDLNEKQRYEKAARHFKDALFLRGVRHDIDEVDSKLLTFCYFLQIHPTWQTVLYTISCIYLALGFFEAPEIHTETYYTEHKTKMDILFGLKGLCMAFFLSELAMDIYHRSYSREIFKEKFLKNRKIWCKIGLDILFLMDFALFYNFQFSHYWRVVRCLRPFSLIFYSKQLSRTFFGIVGSLREILTVIIFFFVISFLFALVAIRVIDDYNHEVEYDVLVSNFKDLKTAFNSMLILLTNDNYPEIALPSLEVSKLYLLFFIPYMLFNILLLVPIPIAVIFDAFRKYRSNLVIQERLKEREAFVACFLTIDVDGSKSIGEDEFMSLCEAIYKKRLNRDKAAEIFEFADKDASDQLNLGSFFEVMEVMEAAKDMKLPLIEIEAWSKFRKQVNRILKLDKFVKMPIIEIFLFFVMLANAIMIAVYGISNDKSLVSKMDQVDKILVYLFMAEIIVNIFGFGVSHYTNSSFRIADVIVTLVSFVFYIPEVLHQLDDYTNSEIILQLTRAQRILKLLRIFKTLKLFKFVVQKVPLLSRMLRLLENIVLCLPTVVRLAVILFMCVYFYAVIGLEIFPSTKAVRFESPYISEFHYTNFDSLGDAFLSLFHIIGGATWSFFLSDYAWRFDSLLKASLYFNSFFIIANRVIISLLTGLVWEVFAFMGKFHGEKEKMEQKLSKGTSNESEKQNKDIVLTESDEESEESEDSDEEDSEELKHFDKKKHSKTLTAKRVAGVSKPAKPLGRKSEYHPKIKPLRKEKLLDKEKMLEDLLSKKEEQPVPRFRPIKKSNSLVDLHYGGDEFNVFEIADAIGSYGNLGGAGSDRAPRNWEPINSLPKAPRGRSSDAQKNSFSQFGSAHQFGHSLSASSKQNLPILPDANFGDDGADASLPEERNGDEKSSLVFERFKTHSSNKLEVGTTLQTNFAEAKQKVNLATASAKHRHRKSRTGGDLPARYYLESNVDADGNTQIEYSYIHEPMNFAEPKNLGGLRTLHKPENSMNSEHDLHNNSNGVIKNIIGFDSSYDQEESSLNQNTGNSPQLNTKHVRNPSHFSKTLVSPSRHLVPPGGKEFNFGNVAKKDPKYIALSDNVADSSVDSRENSPGTLAAPVSKFERKKSRGSYQQNIPTMIPMNLPALVRRSTIGIVARRETVELSNEGQHEREFYIRKITIYGQTSTGKNQLDYIFDPAQKDKFSHEISFLNLQWMDEDNPKDKTPTNDTKKMKMKANMSRGKILRHALLESADHDALQKNEESHFKSVYGNWFDHLENVKLDRVLDIFKTENNILVRITRLLKQHEIVTNDFIEITTMIEASININLLRKGSFGKFLFKDARNKWFTVYKEKNKLRVQYLGKGFWNYFDDVFPDKSQLYEGQDILFPGAKSKYIDVVDEFHQSVKTISGRIIKNTFAGLSREESVWNMYAIPFETSNVKQLRTSVLKEAKMNLKTDLGQVPKRLVTQGVFVSFNFVTKLNKATKVKGYRLSRLENMPMPNQNFFAASADSKGPKNSLNIPQNPLDLLNNSTVSVSEQHNQSVEKGNQADAADEFLPLQEYIDFLRDVRDILHLHKDHFLTKFSMYYLDQDPAKAAGKD